MNKFPFLLAILFVVASISIGVMYNLIEENETKSIFLDGELTVAEIETSFHVFEISDNNGELVVICDMEDGNFNCEGEFDEGAKIFFEYMNLEFKTFCK